MTAFSVLLFFTPRLAAAFWPFSTTQAAAIGSADVPIISDSNLNLLKAAVNSDPNPIKNGDVLALSGGSALIANSGPDGTVAELEGTQNNGRISLYVVRDGDSLSQIASMFDVSTNTILWANDLKSAKDIKPNMTLVILPVSGIRRTVHKGDTLASIASTYHADATDIASFNGLNAGDALVVGTELIIPGGEVPATSAESSAQSSTAKKSSKKSSAPSNPYRGGNGAAVGGWTDPVPGAILTQGIHGWNAVDLAAPAGTPIHAAKGGTVIVVKANGGFNSGWGNYFVVDDGTGVQELYAHESSINVKVGDTVSAGEVVGAVGRTGEATGYHLHFEVRGAKNPGRACTLKQTCYF